MKSAQVSGTEGYAAEAEELFKRYEGIAAADAHRMVLHLIPATPGSILDIGSGTGRDAAWFAGQCHRVVAVEPTDAMRIPAAAREAFMRDLDTTTLAECAYPARSKRHPAQNSA